MSNGGSRRCLSSGLLSFVLFPSLIVASCVLVYVLFGAIARDARTPDELVQEIRTGNSAGRWQAAMLLAGKLQDPCAQQQYLDIGSELVAAVSDSSGDQRTNQFLLLALGRLRHRPAAGLLARHAVESADPQTRLYALTGLACLGGSEATSAAICAVSSDQDPGVRLIGVGILADQIGTGITRSSTEPLEQKHALIDALGDSDAHVRWNAAVGLAQAHAPEAEPVLLEMLKCRDAAVVLRAIGAAAALHTPGLRRPVEQLAREPRGEVGLKAKQALGSWP